MFLQHPQQCMSTRGLKALRSLCRLVQLLQIIVFTIENARDPRILIDFFSVFSFSLIVLDKRFNAVLYFVRTTISELKI